MLEILVFETPEEADKQIEEYKQHNNVILEKLRNYEGNDSELTDFISSEKYYFVAQLGAYKTGDFYFNAQTAPFDASFEKNLHKLAKRVKDMLSWQSFENVEVIFYTVNNHDQANKEVEGWNEEARKGLKELKKEEGIPGWGKKLLNQVIGAFNNGVGYDHTRPLTEAERKKFSRLYYKLSSKPSQD